MSGMAMHSDHMPTAPAKEASAHGHGPEMPATANMPAHQMVAGTSGPRSVFSALRQAADTGWPVGRHLDATRSAHGRAPL